MCNKIKDIDIKNRTYYFFNDIINTNPNNIKIYEKTYKSIIIYFIAYVTIKHSKYVKINSVNPLYFIFRKVNRYFEEINGNKYLTLVLTNESREKVKKYEEPSSKIRGLIRFIAKNSDNCDERYMRIKLNSDEELPLNKTIAIPSMIIVIRAVFYENNKYYLQVFLDECLHKL